MPSVTVTHPAPGTVVAGGQLLEVTGRATGTGGLEPHGVDSVTIRVDGGHPVAADVTQVPHQPLPSAVFTASVPVPPAEGPHQILVTAIDDIGGRASVAVTVAGRATTVFPRFPATARPMVAIGIAGYSQRKRMTASRSPKEASTHGTSAPQALAGGKDL